MKKIVLILAFACVALLLTLSYLVFEKKLVPQFPNFSLPKVTPVPTTTMLNELNDDSIDREVKNDNKINAEGIGLGDIKQGTIEMSNFKFTPDAISVNQGDTVVITLNNVQGEHNFVIDELNVKSKNIKEGETMEVTFVASKKGTFQFYSAIGQDSAIGMVGVIAVN